jgi:uncharacterized protein YbcI
MAGADPPEVEGAEITEVTSLLQRISNMMVAMQKEYFGRGPDRTKSYMLDDLLLVVMRGGVTRAEQTMLDFGQEDLVRNFRQQFENEMTKRLVGGIEELTGRRVLTYQSQILFNPHVICEIFVFEEAADRDQLRETAEGQLTDRSLGEVGSEGEPSD